MIRSKLPNTGTTIFSKISALANKHAAVNLGQGFPNFDVDQRLLTLVSKYTELGKNQYAPMAGVPELRQALANKINLLYDHEVDPETEICITAGATQAIFTAISALIHPGDDVIIIEPAYDSYAPSVILAGGRVVRYQQRAPEFKVDWKELAALITQNTKMIIVNSPQNPIAKVFSMADIQQLEQIVSDHNQLYILSDEVYEHLTFDGIRHQSVLAFPKLYQRSLAVFSFGKTFHATGWKIGYIVAPKVLMTEFKKVHQWNVFSVNSFVQYALAEYLEDESNYLKLPEFYQQKRDYFLGLMSQSKLQPLHSQGSYYQCFDYSAVSQLKDQDFVVDLIVNYGVATIPISSFYAPDFDIDQRIIRVCFAKTNTILEQGAKSLLAL